MFLVLTEARKWAKDGFCTLVSAMAGEDYTGLRRYTLEVTSG
jgi:hypothetical protein